MNLCCSCRQDFTGIRDFDSHRVGVHAYTYTEGLALNPIHEDGRRCLDVAEMQANGWTRDSHGRWSHPCTIAARSRRIRVLTA